MIEEVDRRHHRCCREGACTHFEAWGEWLPFQPLWDLTHPGDVEELSQRIGFTRRTIHRWAARGAVPMDVADEVAVSLGLHPCLIWPEWFDLIFEREPVPKTGESFGDWLARFDTYETTVGV